MSIEEVNKLAKGQVWTGKDSIELNLIDEIGSLKNAIKKAASLANIERYTVKRIYKRKSRLSNFLPFIINEFLTKDNIINKDLEIDYRFEALFSDIKNYNDPKSVYYLCGTCIFIN